MESKATLSSSPPPPRSNPIIKQTAVSVGEVVGKQEKNPCSLLVGASASTAIMEMCTEGPLKSENNYHVSCVRTLDTYPKDSILPQEPPQCRLQQVNGASPDTLHISTDEWIALERGPWEGKGKRVIDHVMWQRKGTTGAGSRCCNYANYFVC